jgi:hypothetical protein
MTRYDEGSAVTRLTFEALAPVRLNRPNVPLPSKPGPSWTARLLTRHPVAHLAKRNVVMPKAVSAAARRVLPVVRSPKLWTPVQWFARMLMGPHRHRQGVAIPVDVDRLQENVMATLVQSAPRSTPQLKGLVQKVLAFREAVPAGDPTATVLMFLQSKVDTGAIKRRVAAKYCSQVGTALERLGFAMDHPTLKDFRAGLRAIADDEETAQAIPLDRETKDRIAADHGRPPVNLMWRTMSRWSDLANPAFPARRKHVEFLSFEHRRPARRGGGPMPRATLVCCVVLNLNGLTKQTSPPLPQPQWRCDHYVQLAFWGHEAQEMHEYLRMEPDEKLIPWTQAEWLRILRSYPVPLETLAACDKKSGHFTLHSVKVGAAAALRQMLANRNMTHEQKATAMIRAMRHTSQLCPQALPPQTVCYHRKDAKYIAANNGIEELMSLL